MKASLPALVLVAVASALVTVGAVELLRSTSPGSSAPSAASPTGSPGGHARRDAAPLAPATLAREPRDSGPRPIGARLEDRLTVLEERMAALELASSSRRAPATGDAGAPLPRDELRDLVLDWVAEEREARRRAQELEHEEERLTELQWGARYQAHMVAEQNDFAPWEESALAAVLLEVETRRAELEESVDLRTDDPAAIEARFAEFDAWAERRMREALGPELYARVTGDD